MNQEYKQMWDARYGDRAYAYGKTPNAFFKLQLDELPPGQILMPAEGEGRNAVYAAANGWDVTAFDCSKEGKKKALQLAQEFELSLDYRLGDLDDLNFEPESFDTIGLIYAHFLADRKSAMHQKLSTCLKKGGLIIFEAFSKNNLPLVKADPKVGGSMPLEMLFSKEEITQDFAGYEILLLEEKEIALQEGNYHNGIGSVIRFVGRKI